MKKLLIAVTLAGAAALSAAAQSPANEIGVGVIAGDPMGGTAKLWLDKTFAIDMGIGFSGSTAFWGDVLYHAHNLLPQPEEGQIALYLGAGPRIETGRDVEFGVRTMAGVCWRLTRQPIELFAEAGPVFRMTQSGGVDADGGIGVRRYLGSR